MIPPARPPFGRGRSDPDVRLCRWIASCLRHGRCELVHPPELMCLCWRVPPGPSGALRSPESAASLRPPEGNCLEGALSCGGFAAMTSVAGGTGS